MGALVRPPRRDALPDVREVRVLRGPEQRPGCSTRRRCTSTGSAGRTRRRSSAASSPATSGRAAPVTPSTPCWCDDRGFVVEDGVILHRRREFLLTAAEPNLAYFEDLVGRHDVEIEDVSDDWGILAVQGPRSRDLARGDRARRRQARPTSISIEDQVGRVPVNRLADRLHRRPGLRDLGAGGRRAQGLGRGLARSARGQGVMPFGMTALYMARIEAGLILLDVDFHSSRFAWTDAERTTPGRARPGLDGPGPRRPTSGRSSGATRSVASRGQDVALAADGAGRRLARLRPDLRRSGPHPAQGPHPDPGRVLPVRRPA